MYSRKSSYLALSENDDILFHFEYPMLCNRVRSQTSNHLAVTPKNPKSAAPGPVHAKHPLRYRCSSFSLHRVSQPYHIGVTKALPSSSATLTVHGRFRHLVQRDQAHVQLDQDLPNPIHTERGLARLIVRRPTTLHADQIRLPPIPRLLPDPHEIPRVPLPLARIPPPKPHRRRGPARRPPRPAFIRSSAAVMR